MWTLRHVTVVVFVGLGALGGCDSILGETLNPAYCKAHPADSECVALGLSTAPQCTSSAQCGGSTPACDLSSSRCFACVAGDVATACAGTTPICGDNHTCVKCAVDSQCAPSSICQLDATAAQAGACLDTTEVAFVAKDGHGMACTPDNPCGTLADALQTAKPFVKISGRVTTQTTAISRAVTILGEPGAVLQGSGGGAILQIAGAGEVHISNVEITGSASTTASADAIDFQPIDAGSHLTLSDVNIHDNQGIGVKATGGVLIVLRSKIANNQGGGISITGAQFAITNNFITDNGNTNIDMGGGNHGSSFGGVSIYEVGADSLAGQYQFDFNTVADNQGDVGRVLGVALDQFRNPRSFGNNIIFDNRNTKNGIDPPQLTADMNVTVMYSDIGTTPQALPAAVPVAGTGNVFVVPQFVDFANGNYHLMGTSALKDSADPDAGIPDDVDRDDRPQDARRDIGADEILQPKP